MAGYVHYSHDGVTDNKIPFCLTSSAANCPTPPYFSYNYDGCATHYRKLPLLDSVTVATGMGDYQQYGNYAYYAVNPTIAIQVNDTTKYVANTRQMHCATSITTSSKTGLFTNNYCNYTNIPAYSITITCNCVNTLRVCAHCGVGSINRFEVGCTPVCAAYYEGCIPNPIQVEAATGVKVCQNGIIGDKWYNITNSSCLAYNASGSSAYSCANFEIFQWKYNTLTNPTFCFKFSFTSCGNTRLDVTMSKNLLTCYSLNYRWCGSGVKTYYDCCGSLWATEPGNIAYSGLNPGSCREATISYCCESGTVAFNNACTLYLIICYTYGTKYYYTHQGPNGPNFGDLYNGTQIQKPSDTAVTWDCLYSDLCFHRWTDLT